MKIGSKIALFYTVITVGAIALIVLVFYLFTLRYINKVYDSYLSEKAYLTAQKYWEKDEVDESRYREIQQKYDELLPQAYEILLNADSVTAAADTLAKYLDRHQQARLFKNEPVTFVYGRLRGAALYYPDNEGNFVVLVMASNHYGQDIQKHILMLAFLLLAVSCGLVFLIGKVYANRILLPLQHLLKDLKRIRVNNLNVRLETFGNKDEWDELIRALNEMLDHLDTAFQAEKAFISNASHELNNPLTAIQGECEICLLKRRPAEEYEEALRRIADESRRISMLIKHLLFLSRHDEDILCRGAETVELAVLLQDLCRQYERVRFDVTGIGAGSELRADSHLLPRLSGTDGLYDFSYLHVFPELIYFCNTHIGTSSPRGTSSARYIPEGTVLPPRKGQCRTSGIYACTNAPFHGPKSFGTVRDSSSWQLPSPSVDARNWNM